MNKVRKQMGISVLYNLPDNWQEETFSHKSDNVGQFSTDLYFRAGVSQKPEQLLERTSDNIEIITDRQYNNTMDRPERLSLQSADGVQLNLDALYQIAPSCFTEAADPKSGG